MPGLIRLLLAAALGLALAGTPVVAQDIHIEPIPPQVKPQWTPVPNVSGVYYAPNLPTDVFRHGSKYYFYWDGYLYRGSKPRGPWKTVTKVPDWFTEIDPSLFKTFKKGEVPPTGPPPAGPTEGVTPIPSAPVPPETAPPPPAPAPEKEGTPTAPGQAPKVM